MAAANLQTDRIFRVVELKGTPAGDHARNPTAEWIWQSLKTRLSVRSCTSRDNDASKGPYIPLIRFDAQVLKISTDLDLLGEVHR